jgi:hypothetical protein
MHHHPFGSQRSGSLCLVLLVRSTSRPRLPVHCSISTSFRAKLVDHASSTLLPTVLTWNGGNLLKRIRKCSVVLARQEHGPFSSSIPIPSADTTGALSRKENNELIGEWRWTRPPISPQLGCLRCRMHARCASATGRRKKIAEEKPFRGSRPEPWFLFLPFRSRPLGLALPGTRILQESFRVLSRALFSLPFPFDSFRVSR